MTHLRAAQFGWVLSLAAAVSVAHGDDWPQWGGPQRDLVWREAGLVESLPEGELPRVWAMPIGSGYAGPAVADGRVFVTDRVAEDDLERVWCFDAEDGREIWKHEYKAPYTISYPLGPRATPTVDEGRVYTLGAEGHLFCLKADSGEVVWQKELQADFGTKLPIWGMAAAPLVDGEQLIVLAGGADGALVVSLDKHTGREIWRALEDQDVGYAPPVIFEFGGQRQLIVWRPKAVSALDPAHGEVLWEVPFAVKSQLSIATPRKLGNRLFVAAFYDGPLMIDVGANGRSPQVLWRGAAGNTEVKNDSLHPIMCTPLVTEDRIYGVGAYGELRCLDTASGRMMWETHEATGEGRWWHAFIVPHGQMSGERVFLHNEQGDLIIAQLKPDGYHELSRAKMIDPTQPVQRRMTVWSHPAFAMRSVFARNDKEIIRVNLAAE